MDGIMPWCWEAAYDRHGPDWQFYAVVTTADAGELERLAAGATLEGFSACGLNDLACAYHGQTCPTYVFIDTASAPAYRSNLAGGTQSNLYIYNSVHLHRDLIEIACGYGGRGAAHNAAETALLLALFATPGVTVQHWHITAGGEGYDYRSLREGEGAASLLAYLGGAPS